MKFKRVLLSLVPFLAVGTTASISLLVNKEKLEQVNADTVADYESFISSWSKKDHLYIHYNRGENAAASDSDQYALWIWQHKPQDIGGSLWAYGGKTQVSASLKLDPMTTGYMKGEDVKKSGSTMWTDQYGAIIDVDMGAEIRSGKVGGGNASLKGATEIGFLIVLESSMDGTTHWTSDGGKNTYLENFNAHFRADGSVHVYLNSGDFDSYVYDAKDAPAPVVNPVTEDTTGQYTSKTDNIADTYGVSKTSDAFKS